MKKTKFMTRVIAVVFALAILFAMSVPAVAATDSYKGSENNAAVFTPGTTNIPLTKSIVMFNTNGSLIREPNITYTYTVAPVSSTVAQGATLTGVTVTDDGTRNVISGTNTPVTVNVYNGVAAAITNSLPLVFTENNAKASAAVGGTELERTDNLVVDPSLFPHAGIFRFKITEAYSVDPTTVGLDARTADYDDTRFLDVYIGNSASGQEMYGAVIFKSVQTGTSIGLDSIEPNSFEKTTGFEPNADPDTGATDYENDNTVDKYHTFNLEVNKTITGGLADKTHDFPFEITLTGNKTATIKADYSKTGATYVGGTEPTTVDINTTAITLTPALSDGDSVTITGIPVVTTVLVKETNNTTDKYTPSISTQTGFTGLTLTTTGLLDANASTQMSAAAEITDKTQKSVIGLTNTLSELSPTGLVFRVAPYVLMLAAGVSLIVLFAKRRREITDMI